MSQRDPKVWEEKQKQLGESYGTGSFHLQEADTVWLVSLCLSTLKGIRAMRHSDKLGPVFPFLSVPHTHIVGVKGLGLGCCC